VEEERVFIASWVYYQHKTNPTVPSNGQIVELSCAWGPLFPPESPIANMKGRDEK